jgi:hypothetical protein
VIAANDLNAIEDASFSVSYWNTGSGNYLIEAATNQVIAVSAPNYQTSYVINPGIIELTYIGGWPQSY